ncbi:hypothetical protein ACVW0P_004516 [Mucilaginibacter sp. UYNi724]
MTISDKVKSLTAGELTQATYLYHQNRKAARAVIPKPSTGTIRLDGSLRRFLFKETRHTSAGETQVYLDTLHNQLMQTTYSEDPLTGYIKSESEYVTI